MKARELVLPPRFVYTVEGFKFEACLAYVLIFACTVWALTDSLQTGSGHILAADASFYDAPVYALSGKPAIPRSINMPALHAGMDGSVWPVHGKIFTEFGVPHRPYQRTHTGIDISTAKPRGVAAVTVFRAGTVIQAGSNGGMGNSVTVDHGAGLTSLYGHLHNIRVSPGQQVSPGMTIGHEGSTGRSTGPHVHFEIQEHGRPVNPHKYLPGSP
jgi:murein DD-endopeptidase MepM/ murein hydrolase activator NlpD